MMWHDMDSGSWTWMTSMMVVFWALVIIGIAVVVRTMRQDRDVSPRPTAQELLDERFARGEVSVEEYEERRGMLTGPGRPAKR